MSLPSTIPVLEKRLSRESEGEKDDQPRAAVATVLRDSPQGEEILLIRRGHREGDPWSGHMAFPGGRHDPRDSTLLETAIRETREEVRLDLRSGARWLGRLPDLPAMSRGKPAGLLVSPFVFHLQNAATPVPDGVEVHEVLWAPVGKLFRGEWDTVHPYRHGEHDLQLPAYSVEGRVVWGLTYQMLQILFQTIREAT